MHPSVFLLHPAAQSVPGPAALATPPERWVQAFPDGLWLTWARLLQSTPVQASVWLPVGFPDWGARVSELMQRAPDCRVVVLSNMPDDTEGLRALEAGARGYCHLCAAPEVLREVEQVVQHGGLWVGPSLVQRLVAATRELVQRVPDAPWGRSGCDLTLLSEREAQVAQAVALGKSNREVAAQLFISERTVKAHLGAIFDKLEVRDRVQLVLRLQGSSANAGAQA